MKKDKLIPKKIKIAIGVTLLLTTILLFMGFSSDPQMMEGLSYPYSIMGLIALSIIDAAILDIFVGIYICGAFVIVKKIKNLKKS